MRIGVFGVVAIGLLTAACGTNTQERAATGGLSGLAVGAAVGGPVGAAVGAAAGAVGGWAMPEGAETIAVNALHKEKTASAGALNEVGLGSGSGSSHATADQVKQAQAELQHEGFYRGPIDGVAGPDTRQAIAAHQARAGLPQTATLDQATRECMKLAAASQGQARRGAARPAMSADRIRDRLQAQGYTNVNDVQEQSPRFYTAKAERGNDGYALRIDARTGQIVSERRLAANQSQGATAAGAASTSGTSSPPPDANQTSPAGQSGAPAAGANGPNSTSTSTESGGAH